MTALFCLPTNFTVVNSTSAATAPASNTNSDILSLVWKSGTLTTPYVILDFGSKAVSYDTIGIVGTNLRPTDKWRVRTGTTNTGIGSYDSGSGGMNASSQTVPTGWTSKSILKLTSSHTERYMRLDFTATSHPDGYVMASRIVVGASVTTQGIATEAERIITDQSLKYSGAGYSTFQIYPKLAGWKMTVPWLTDSEVRSTWVPFLSQIGQSSGFLFSPDIDAGYHVTDACYGTIQSASTNIKNQFANAWNVDLTVMNLQA